MARRKSLFNGNFEFKLDNVAGASDTPEVVGGGEGSAAPSGGGRAGKPDGIGVAELLRMVRGAISSSLPRTITVVGEISNLSQPASGHIYFSLKDSEAQIPAAMFRSSAAKMKFQPTDGMEVLVTGRVDVYEAQGKLQLYATRMEPRGIGSLELAFRQLCDKLRAEGLFDAEHKKPIPRFPSRICVITSPTGAAIRDISNTLRRRWPAAEVFLVPVAVQGDGAAEQIAAAIDSVSDSAQRLQIDTLIVGRGGGSLEDLWCFNEEIVARAVFDCCVPVISGVGHEVDTSICDMVADLRVATPTAAAERAVPDRLEYAQHCTQLNQRMMRRCRDMLSHARSHLQLAERAELFARPMAIVDRWSQRVDEAAAAIRVALLQGGSDGRRRVDKLTERLRWALGYLAKIRGDELSAARLALRSASPQAAIKRESAMLESRQKQLAASLKTLVARDRTQLEHVAAMLEAMSYRKVLKRGFSVTRGADGKCVSSAAAAMLTGQLEIEFADGRVRSKVDSPLTANAKTPRKATKKPPKPDSEQPGLFD